MLNEDQLRKNFIAWRGRKAGNEAYAIDTVILIANYVHGKDVATMDLGLTPNSEIIESFGAYRHIDKLARFYGAIVYGKLTIEHYLEQSKSLGNLPPDEKDALDAILSSLSSLYTSIYYYPKYTLDQLIQNTRRWLEIVNHSAKTSEVTSASLSLYALQKILVSALAQCTPTERSALNTLGLQIETITAEIEQLMRATTDKIGQLNPEPANIAAEETPRPLQRELEQASQASPANSEDEDSDNDVYEDAIDVPFTDVQPSPANTLERRIDNETHAAPFNIDHHFNRQTLILLARDDLSLTEKIRLIQEELQTIHDNMDRLLKAQRMIPLCGRLVEQNVPDDSQQIPDDSQQIIERCIGQLAGEHHEAKRLLQTLAIEKLEELIIKNRAIYGVMPDLTTLVHQITTHHKHLQTVQGLDVNIDAFILKYNTIFVRLSHFIAQWLGAWFKTDAADKIEQARLMQQQLSSMKTNYQEQFEAGISAIRSNKDISEVLKRDFEEVITQLPQTIVPEPLPPRNMITAFNLINTLFSDLRPRPTAHAADPAVQPAV